MSKHNGLSDTQILKIPDEYRDTPPPARPVRPAHYVDPERPVRQRPPIQRASLQGSYTQPPPDEYPPQQPYEPPYQPYEQPYPPPYQEPYREPPRQHQPDARPKKRKHKRRRRRRRFGCLRSLLVSLLVMVILLFGLYSAISVLAIRQLHYTETGPRNITTTLAEKDSNIRNILLIGTKSDDSTQTAESVLLMSFSRHNKTITVTSLIPDSYVSIPGHGTNKLTAAYANGGATLLMDTVVNNFGIAVDDYICVNFKAFVHLADSLGGIELHITDEEAAAMNRVLQDEINRVMGDNTDADLLPSGGNFKLNGKQALAYTRIHFLENADFAQAERQREVVQMLVDKWKQRAVTAAPVMVRDAMPEISTNISAGSLYLMSLRLPVDLAAYDMQMLRLPADGTFTPQTAPDGQPVLAVDFDANRQIFYNTVTVKQERAK